MTRYKKEAEAKSQIVRVRDIGSTYVATGGGKRTSCTAGPYSAAHAHASKLFGDRPFNLVSNGPCTLTCIEPFRRSE